MAVKLEVIQTPTAEQLQVRLRAMSGDLGDFKLFHFKASILLDRWVHKNIRSQGSMLQGEGWEPFAAGGRHVRGKGIDTSAKLLRDTGTLEHSYMPFHSSFDAGVGSKLPYSKYHELGDENTSIPVRRVLPEEPEIRDMILVLLNDHAARVAKRLS